MKQVKSCDIETENGRFDLLIYQDHKRGIFVGKYSGYTPGFAQVVPDDCEPPEIEFSEECEVHGTSLEDVEQRCRKEIQEKSGNIMAG